MSGTVYLHVGLPKSGTSYLQRLLSTNKARLADEAGLLFPGETWLDQVQAVRDVRDMPAKRSRPQSVAGAWAALVDQIARWPASSVVSMEWLAAADHDQIRRIVGDLAPAQVEVVFTARDLGRTLPAAWQEFVQDRITWSWEDFLAGVQAEDRGAEGPGRPFWAQQDLPVLVDRWAGVVGLDHVQVVVVPPPGAGRSVLWDRMAEALGIPGQTVVEPAEGHNASLGLESVELMRRLNPRTVEAGFTFRQYRALFKHALAKQVLSQRAGSTPSLAVPADYHAWVRSTSSQQIAAVRGLGVTVVGDLEELQPVLRDGSQPGDVTDGDLADAAIDGLVGMGGRLQAAHEREQALERRVERLQARVTRQEERLRSTRERIDEFEAAPLRSAFDRYRSALRHRLRALRGRR